jgi:hypothetical protein
MTRVRVMLPVEFVEDVTTKLEMRQPLTMAVEFVEDLTTNFEIRQTLTMAVEFVLQIGLKMSWWLELAS